MLKQNSKCKWMVSTDLDGTLLDHHSYSWLPAETALSRLASLNIPVVLNTSKTLQEAKTLAAEMSLSSEPIIVENGSAIFFQKTSRLVEFGAKRGELVSWLREKIHDHGYQLECYSDWSVQQIMDATGLGKLSAQASANKHYSEPFIWNDSLERLANFMSQAESAGYKVLKGGRFYHLQGMVDKATPLNWLRKNVSEIWPEYTDLSVIALGDNQNDVDMLNASDYPICIKSPVAVFPELADRNEDLPAARYSNALGPEGWNEQIQKLLNELKFEDLEVTHG